MVYKDVIVSVQFFNYCDFQTINCVKLGLTFVLRNSGTFFIFITMSNELTMELTVMQSSLNDYVSCYGNMLWASYNCED